MTGKMTTLARPYAISAFEYASQNAVIPAWEAMLDAAGYVTQDVAVQSLLKNPKVSTAQIMEFYSSVLTSMLDTEKTNFIKLLAENNRLSVLPDIAALFKVYRSSLEKTVIVDVTSAIPLDQAYQKKLVEALTKRLQRQVKLECHVDESILGGIVVRTGDNVIDGSVRGKLHRMVEFISGIS